MIAGAEDKMRGQYKITVLIYFAMVASVLIYALFVELIQKNPSFTGASEQDFQLNPLRYVLFGLSVAMFFIIKYLRNYLFSNSFPSNPSVSIGISGWQANNQSTRNPSSNFFIIEIVTYALCESVAIYGLVLFFIGKRSQDFYILMCLSLIYFAIYFPRYAQWEEWASKISSRELP